MWSFWISAPVAAIAITTAMSVTGGPVVMLAAAASGLLHRRKGYHPKEGELSTKIVVRFDSNGCDINRDLASILPLLPDFKHDEFIMTAREVMLLTAMITPVLSQYSLLMSAMTSSSSSSEDIIKLAKTVTETIMPVRLWLEQFPRRRQWDVR